MAKPEHPDTIIIKNEFYPKGLTELDIYNYYTANRKKILDNLKARSVVFFIIPDINSAIVKRRMQGSFIVLNAINYDRFITGRTISIHATMKSFDDIGIVDIDCDNFESCKKLTFDIDEYLESLQTIKNTQIRFTGKRGFHIFCKLDQSYDTKSIHDIFKDALTDKFGDIISIDKKGSSTNIDLSPNKPNGAFITLYSLSVLGLKCLPIERKKIKLFQKGQAKIK